MTEELKILFTTVTDKAKKDINKFNLELNKTENTSKQASKGIKTLKTSLDNTNSTIKSSNNGLNNFSSGLESMVTNMVGVAALITTVKKSIDFLADSYMLLRADNIELSKTQAIITSTGSSAGVTAKDIADLSNELQNLTGISNTTFISASNLLLTFKAISGALFLRAMSVIGDMTALFGSAESAAIQLGKALEDPTTGLTAMRRVGVSFSESQKEAVYSMMELGKVAEAQTLILEVLEGQFGGVGKASRDSLNVMRNDWDDFRKQFAKSYAPEIQNFHSFMSEILRFWTKTIKDMELVKLDDGTIIDAKTQQVALDKAKNYNKAFKNLSLDELNKTNNELRLAREDASRKIITLENKLIKAESDSQLLGIIGAKKVRIKKIKEEIAEIQNIFDFFGNNMIKTQVIEDLIESIRIKASNVEFGKLNIDELKLKLEEIRNIDVSIDPKIDEKEKARQISFIIEKIDELRESTKKTNEETKKYLQSIKDLTYVTAKINVSVDMETQEEAFQKIDDELKNKELSIDLGLNIDSNFSEQVFALKEIADGINVDNLNISIEEAKSKLNELYGIQQGNIDLPIIPYVDTEKIKEDFSLLENFSQEAVDNISQMFSHGLTSALEQTWGAILDGEASIKSFEKMALDVIKNIIKQLLVMQTLFAIGSALGLSPKTIESMGGINFFGGKKDGGKITGMGTGTSDSIPTMLSNGEFVINAKATKENLSLLESINNNQIQKFSTGGLVTNFDNRIQRNSYVAGVTTQTFTDSKNTENIPIIIQNNIVSEDILRSIPDRTFANKTRTSSQILNEVSL